MAEPSVVVELGPLVDIGLFVLLAGLGALAGGYGVAIVLRARRRG